MEDFEAHSFTVSTMGVIASLVFLVLPWFSKYFPFIFKWNTFFIRISLPLYHSFIQEWFTLPFLRKFLPVCSPTKNSRIWFPPLVKEKSTMKHIVYETRSYISEKIIYQKFISKIIFLNQFYSLSFTYWKDGYTRILKQK